jgi:hypothetical protein
VYLYVVVVQNILSKQFLETVLQRPAKALLVDLVGQVHLANTRLLLLFLLCTDRLSSRACMASVAGKRVGLHGDTVTSLSAIKRGRARAAPAAGRDGAGPPCARVFSLLFSRARSLSFSRARAGLQLHNARDGLDLRW